MTDYKAKVLVLDIETSPLLAYVWGIHDQYIASNQLYKDWYIIAWGAKWLGEKEVIYRDARKWKYGNDRIILKPLWHLLNEADIVLTQNGKKFDIKKINARFILHGMKPPKPFKHLDTYLLVKHVASFTSNSLSYLSKNICSAHKKDSHHSFPGFNLWKECLLGNVKAWEEMKHYNIKDVLSTEELYLKLQAWVPEHMPNVYPVTKHRSHCGTCGYFGQMQSGRPRHGKLYSYKQNRCPKCGHWQKGERLI